MESNHGVKCGGVAKEVLAILNPHQQQILNTASSDNLREFDEFVKARARLMRELETALTGNKIDSEQVQKFGTDIGEIEAGMTWTQAMAMLQVRGSLSDQQSTDLLEMRSKYIAENTSSVANPVERGQQLFAQCVLCHASDNNQAIAPDLTGIVGRAIATEAKYEAYSAALNNFAKSDGVWSEALLDEFLTSPRNAVPGTYMSFDGLSDAQDREALITYLKTTSSDSKAQTSSASNAE